MPKYLSRIVEYLRSVKFYRLILGLFIFEAGWIAVSAAYPQAFDENFHFGLIKVYSHYWLPFLSSQPPHANAYGSVARNPSYLYHYLMSFPYRLIALFVHKQIIQVIVMRFLNIALFSWGIVLFRKILLRVGTSKALTNMILALFILVPIVPQLAGQVSYDNLLFPLTAAFILLGFRVVDEIRDNHPSIWSISMLAGFGILISLVKYAFMPIYAGMALFLLVLLHKKYKHQYKQFFKQLAASWSKQKQVAKIAIIAIMVISLGLFAQRDGYNLVVFHSLDPNCSKVLSVKQCLAYSPWAYNYHNKAIVAKGNANFAFSNPFVYFFQWLYWMWYRLFFAVNGPKHNFKNYPPLPLPSLAMLIVTAVGLVALVKWWRKIFSGNIYLLLLFIVTAIYLIALMGHGYATYLSTNVLENMNGRYLIPIMLLAAAIFGQALSRIFKVQTRKTIFALVILVLFLEGGGLLTFIARSDSTWYVQNKAIVKVNNTARNVVKKVVVKGHVSRPSGLWFLIN